MEGRIDWDLLARCLRGECTDEEEAVLRAWCEGVPAREALLNAWLQIRKATARSVSQPDVEALWREVHTHIRRQAEIETLQIPDRRAASLAPSSRARRSSHFSVRLLLRLGIVVLVGALALFVMQRQERPRVDKVFVTHEGQRATLRLADGTRVQLNVDSKLMLLPTFDAGARKVQLQGEAYFDVAEDAGRPFVVHAGGTSIRVLGTEFDVRAYREGVSVQVVVAEGRVSFHPEPTPLRKGVVLTARQMGKLLRSGKHVVLEEVDLDQHLAWMEGQLVLVDAPFDEVVRKLERWYALDVVLTDPSMAPGHLNARFTGCQSLREILNVIAITFGLQYEKEGRTVAFFPNQSS